MSGPSEGIQSRIGGKLVLLLPPDPNSVVPGAQTWVPVPHGESTCRNSSSRSSSFLWMLSLSLGENRACACGNGLLLSRSSPWTRIALSLTRGSSGRRQCRGSRWAAGRQRYRHSRWAAGRQRYRRCLRLCPEALASASERPSRPSCRNSTWGSLSSLSISLLSRSASYRCTNEMRLLSQRVAPWSQTAIAQPCDWSRHSECAV
jgi:hypothetical protein